jgi:hypothetical protein
VKSFANPIIFSGTAKRFFQDDTMRNSPEIWKPVAEAAIYFVLLWKYLTADEHRSVFDVVIEGLVYAMPLAILYGIVKRRRMTRRSRAREKRA